MNQPRIELIPLRPAVRSDAPVTLDVLVKITPPAPNAQVRRPALNLGLVLDRSGSMAAQNKIGFARDAAAFAVQELLPTDRVSVTIFDDRIDTIVPNAPVANSGRIVAMIREVIPRGSTALHGGWEEGGRQVRQQLLAAGLNRVLLLSDGLANVGKTEPDAIANDVNRLAREGVSTTTMGVGDDYNEDLLEAMARSGDGNYYYVEGPQQLPTIFLGELQGLMMTFGGAVTLGVEPQSGATVADVLNDFDRTPEGRLKLPNLVAGMPILVVVRLNVPAATGEGEICRFHLGWDDPKEPGRKEAAATLRLPTVGTAVWEALSPNFEVQERSALLLIARLKNKATRRLKQGDLEGAKHCLAEARRILADAPATAEVRAEAAALAQIEAYTESGDWNKFQKHAKHQAYRRTTSRS